MSVAGLGTLALPAANTYSAGTTINNETAGVAAGVLSVSTGSTLSSPTPANPLFSSSIGSGAVTYTSGVLQNAAVSGLTFNNVVTINTSVANTAAVFAGNALTLTGNVAISTTNSTVLVANATTITGTFSGTVNLTLSSTPIVAGSGAGNSNLIGASGSLTLSGGSGVFTGNTFSGNVTINGGTLDLNNFGTIASTGATAVTVGIGGTFQLDNSAVFLQPSTTSLPSRLTGAAPGVTLNGGTLAFAGSNTSGAVVLQTITTVALAVGNSTISLTKNSGVNALTIGTLTRSAGATVNLVGTDVALTTGGVGTAGNQILVTTLGAGAVGTTVNGGVATATVTTASGYTSAPSVTFGLPTETGGVQATGTVIFNSATSLTVVITNPGSGYTAPRPSRSWAAAARSRPPRRR